MLWLSKVAAGSNSEYCLLLRKSTKFLTIISIAIRLEPIAISLEPIAISLESQYILRIQRD